MDLSKYQPLDDRILILPDKQDDTIHGFAVADDKKPKKLTGTVVAVGTGVPLMNVKLEVSTMASPAVLVELDRIITMLKQGRPMKVKKGDRVIYGQFAGTRLPIDGEEYLMLRESDVFMIVNE